MRSSRQSPDHSGEGGGLSEWRVVVVKSVHHLRAQLYFVAGSPIRRHRRDPQRRKSSIDLRPLGTGFSCSHWRIFFTTALKPPWRSTVSQSALETAWRRTAASALPAAGSRVVQAWRTRWVRSRCCWSHSPVRPSHIPGRLRSSVDEPYSVSIPPCARSFQRSAVPNRCHPGDRSSD